MRRTDRLTLTELDRVFSFMHGATYDGSMRQAAITMIRRYSDEYVMPPAHIEDGTQWIPLITNHHDDFHLRSQVCSDTNVREAARLIGGGAWSMVRHAERYARVCGGVGNVMRGLYQYVRPLGNYEWRVWDAPPPREYAKMLFGLDEHEYLNTPLLDADLKAMLARYRIPTDTSGGTIAKCAYKYGIPKKLGVVWGHLDEFQAIMEVFKKIKLKPNEIPCLPWRCGVRGKMIDLENAIEDMEAGKVLSRLVSVCEPLEHYLLFPIYQSLMDRLKLLRRSGRMPTIQIGIRKNSIEWPELRAAIQQYKYVLTTDWSGFDASVPVDMLRYVWSVILCCFNVRENDDVHRYYVNMTNFYELNFINSVYVMSSLIVKKNRGIPSGSILTSLVGSIINAVILTTLLRESTAVKRFRIFVYGDDAIVGIDSDVELEARNRGRAFLQWLRNRAYDKWRMTLKMDDTELALTKDMCYVLTQPQYDRPAARLRQGTRGLIPTSHRIVDDFTVPIDYERGYTHRAVYDKKHCVHFLKKGFDRMGRPINSAFESLKKLVNPEHASRSIRESIDRVLSSAAENVHNRLYLNQCCYLYLALHAMQYTVGIGVQKWPLALSQRIYRGGDRHAKLPNINNEWITTSSGGKMMLTFRARDHYVELYNDPIWGPIIRDFEDKIEKRTGWRDVQVDWERLIGGQYPEEERYVRLSYPHIRTIDDHVSLSSTIEAPRNKIVNAVLAQIGLERGGAEGRKWGKSTTAYHILAFIRKVIMYRCGRIVGPYVSFFWGARGPIWPWETQEIKHLRRHINATNIVLNWCSSLRTGVIATLSDVVKYKCAGGRRVHIRLEIMKILRDYAQSRGICLPRRDAESHCRVLWRFSTHAQDFLGQPSRYGKYIHCQLVRRAAIDYIGLTDALLASADRIHQPSKFPACRSCLEIGLRRTGLPAWLPRRCRTQYAEKEDMATAIACGAGIRLHLRFWALARCREMDTRCLPGE